MKLIKIYYYQLFGSLLKDYDKNTIQLEYFDFINQLSSIYNSNFVYSCNYNLILKLTIKIKLTIIIKTYIEKIKQ